MEKPEVLKVMEQYSKEELDKFAEYYDAHEKAETDEERKFYLGCYRFLCSTGRLIRKLRP